MMEKPNSHSHQPKPQNSTQTLCNILLNLPFMLLLAVPLVAITAMALLFLMPLLAILWMLLYPLWPLLLLLLLLWVILRPMYILLK